MLPFSFPSKIWAENQAVKLYGRIIVNASEMHFDLCLRLFMCEEDFYSEKDFFTPHKLKYSSFFYTFWMTEQDPLFVCGQKICNKEFENRGE